jgi:hypothetical protein
LNIYIFSHINNILYLNICLFGIIVARYNENIEWTKQFDHSPNIISNLNKYIYNKDLRIDFDFLSESIHHSSLDLECSRYSQCTNIHKNWQRVFGLDNINQECIFGSGGQFIVSKNKIYY